MSDAKSPHCDSLVLHSPRSCEICDEFPLLQFERLANKINFTGENITGLAQCPAEARRKYSSINRWYGNTPKPASACECGGSAVGGGHSDYCPLHITDSD